METENYNKYEMHKRRELMADNRRYIIYYTFGESPGAAQTETKSAKDAPLTKTINSDSEPKNSGAM